MSAPDQDPADNSVDKDAALKAGQAEPVQEPVSILTLHKRLTEVERQLKAITG